VSAGQLLQQLYLRLDLHDQVVSAGQLLRQLSRWELRKLLLASQSLLEQNIFRKQQR
jgi:hypothetical protein